MVKSIILALALFAKFFLIQSSILSKSSLESCIQTASMNNNQAITTSLDCKKKIVTIITLEHGQDAKTEHLQIVLDKVSEGQDERELIHPIRIDLTKSIAAWHYPIRYLADVNNRPKEHVIKTKLFFSCNANPISKEEDLTCGAARDEMGDRILHSEGFCCKCTIGKLLSNSPTRGSLGCSNIVGFFNEGASAHCLYFDDLWYSVFAIDAPMVDFDILVEVSQQDSNTTDLVSAEMLSLSHREQYKAFSKGKETGFALEAELIGDLASVQSAPILSTRYLAIPTYPASHPLVTDSRNDSLKHALLLETRLFDLSGRTCNKIGVSYEAFKMDQANACEGITGDCLKSQISDFVDDDEDRIKDGYEPLNYASSHCKHFPPELLDISSTNERLIMLTCGMIQRHTSIVRLEFQADDILFVRNVAEGVILRATLKYQFEALRDKLELTTSIQNVGLISAEYSVSIRKCELFDMESNSTISGFSSPLTASMTQVVFLEAREEREVEFEIFSNSPTMTGSYQCLICLSDVLGGEIHSFTILVNTTALKQDRGAQGGLRPGEANELLSGAYPDNTCASLCPNFFDIPCFLVHRCWEGLVGSIIILILLITCCCACIRLGPKLVLQCLYGTIKGVFKRRKAPDRNKWTPPPARPPQNPPTLERNQRETNSGWKRFTKMLPALPKFLKSKPPELPPGISDFYMEKYSNDYQKEKRHSYDYRYDQDNYRDDYRYHPDDRPREDYRNHPDDYRYHPDDRRDDYRNLPGDRRDDYRNQPRDRREDYRFHPDDRPREDYRFHPDDRRENNQHSYRGNGNYQHQSEDRHNYQYNPEARHSSNCPDQQYDYQTVEDPYIQTVLYNKTSRLVDNKSSRLVDNKSSRSPVDSILTTMTTSAPISVPRRIDSIVSSRVQQANDGYGKQTSQVGGDIPIRQANGDQLPVRIVSKIPVRNPELKIASRAIESNYPVRGDESNYPVRGDESKSQVIGGESKPHVRGNESKPHVKGNESKPHVKGDESKPHVKVNESKSPVIGGESKPHFKGDESKSSAEPKRKNPEYVNRTEPNSNKIIKYGRMSSQIKQIYS